MKPIRHLAALAAVLTLASAGSAKAQRVTLVHGFYSDGNTWTAPFNTAMYLQTTYGIPVDNPSYSWYLPISLGAATLEVNDPANTILIGHSEGGIVIRRYAETHRVLGLMTLGTPHYGANMAT